MPMKIIANILVILSIVLGLSWVYLEGHYANILPKEPIQSEGRTYLLNVHGAVVYLTSSENELLNYFQYGALACGICGGLLWQKSTRRK